jgi:transcriptional antiterminator RfaH
VPLFSGYVFVYGEEGERNLAMTTNCVSRWLSVPDREKLTQDLRQIQRLIASSAPLTPEARLLPGMRVRVRSGLLAGIEGDIVSRQGQARLVVAVNFLRQGASLLLEDCQVERVE